MPCPTIPLDTSRLQKFAREGVPAGDADAQMRLGHMHYRGADGARNDVEARRLYRLSAAQGNAEAQAKLGKMHYIGKGGPEDLAEARRLCGLAAAQGDAEAQYGLGDMHYDGIHQVDIARWLVGVDYPKSVFSNGARYDREGGAETPDTQLSVFEFDDLMMELGLIWRRVAATCSTRKRWYFLVLAWNGENRR